MPGKHRHMRLIEHCSLKYKHTFHLDVKSRFWVDAFDEQEISSLLSDNRFAGLQMLPVGAGSNLLFTTDFNGLLLHVDIQSIEVLQENDEYVDVRVGAGVVWDDLVAWAVAKGLSGIENLSGIPGCVGASPVQNIGAYGSEAKDTIYAVEAIDRKSREQIVIKASDCKFSYRNSVFKQEFKDKYVVCRVIYRLLKEFHPNLSYGDLDKRIHESEKEVSLETIRDTILKIRDEKLPDPAIFGNAGSFFMNPVLTAGQYHQLKVDYPTIPGWNLADGTVKVPAAWCIEQTGWKGRDLGNAGVHPIQPLVLINKGGATAFEITTLAERIKSDVLDKFGISLTPEVLYV